jgi:rhodanese-related sulfurtransferase
MAAIDPNVEPFSRLEPREAARRVEAGEMALIDVREDDEWAKGHARGAIHFPLNKVFTNTGDLPEDKGLVFICSVGQRSALAAEYAAAVGRKNLANVEGGTDAWKAAGLPME